MRGAAAPSSCLNAAASACEGRRPPGNRRAASPRRLAYAGLPTRQATGAPPHRHARRTAGLAQVTGPCSSGKSAYALSSMIRRMASMASQTSVNRVLRGGSEPEPARGPVVADDPGLDEGLADPPRLGVAQADVRPPPGGIPRRGQHAAERRQPGVRQVDEVAGQQDPFGAQRMDARLADCRPGRSGQRRRGRTDPAGRQADPRRPGPPPGTVGWRKVSLWPH